MNWSDLKETVGQFAPLVGTVLGGAPGAAIGAALANVLGTSNTPQAIDAAIKTDPLAVLKIQQYESDNQVKLQEQANQVLLAIIEDGQHAREQHKDSKVPAALVFILTLFSAGFAYFLFTQEIPVGNKEITYFFGGQLVTFWGTSLYFWLGRPSNVNSNIPTKMIRKV